MALLKRFLQCYYSILDYDVNTQCFIACYPSIYNFKGETRICINLFNTKGTSEYLPSALRTY